jgi:hypothetical protein
MVNIVSIDRDLILKSFLNLIEEYDDKYRLLKRFSINKNPTQRSQDILDNLFHPSSSWNEKSTDSSYYPSCRSNPCENGGICTSKGQMTDECKCVGPWRGPSCGVGR